MSTLDAVQSDSVSNEAPYSVVTWVERIKGEYTIFSRSCIKLAQSDDERDHWSTTVILHRSQNPITSSSLVLLDKQQILFWTEQQGKKTIIKYRSKDAKQYQIEAAGWRKENIFHDQGTENIGINLLRQNGNLWAFWASTKSTLPDIQYSQFDAQQASWTPSQLVHPVNQVPDIQPTSFVNQQGSVVLNWLTYSLLQSRYVQAEKVFPNVLDISDLIDIIDVHDFTIPDFIPAGQAVTLRFPRNDFVQSLVTGFPQSDQP